MIEARDLRVASHKEQIKAAAQSFNLHAAGGVGVASAASPSAASSSADAFLPPPSAHTARPWTVVEITPRRIQIDVAGCQQGIAIEWPQGISAPFQILTTDLQHSEQRQHAANQPTPPCSPSQLPAHQCHLLCHQSVCLLLEHTMKNSLGQRKSLELLADHDGSSFAMRRDPAVAATGVGASATGQEESWPTRAPSIVQFLVMATNHWRIVREVRQAIRTLQLSTKPRSTLSSGPVAATGATLAADSAAGQQAALLPPFRVKIARNKQPHVYAFTVTVRKRSVERHIHMDRQQRSWDRHHRHAPLRSLSAASSLPSLPVFDVVCVRLLCVSVVVCVVIVC